MICNTTQYVWGYVLPIRQGVHLANRSKLTRLKVDKKGTQYLDRPTKKDVYNAEVKGIGIKSYASDFALSNPDSLVRYKRSIKKRVGEIDVECI